MFALVATALNVIYYLIQMMPAFVAAIPYYLMRMMVTFVANIPHYLRLFWDAMIETLVRMYSAAVMKERVAQSTRKGYDSRNLTFMIWLFDNDHRNLIQAAILKEMKRVDREDKSRRTRKGKKCKKREYLRQCCGDILKGIDPTQSHTLPVKLEELTIQVFTVFLNTSKKKVKRDSNEAFGDKELEIRLKPSSFDGACSSLSYLFQESGIDKDVNEVTKELWSKIAAYKKGTRRKIDDIPLADCVCIKHPWSKADDTPRCTGIPADIMIMAEFESLKEKMK